MACCKEKAVLVAVYEEKPRKRRTTRNNDNIKHHHHHHHHHYHHLHVDESKKREGNDRRAELLSYSKHLRESKKIEASTSTHRRPKSLETSTRKDQETLASVLYVENKQKLKKQPSCLNMNKIFKCFAMSQAKRKAKKKKKKSSESSAKKASAIMKTFNAKTQKGARRFFSKVMATIQKYRPRPNTTNSRTTKPDKGHAPDIPKTHITPSLLGLVQDLHHSPFTGPIHQVI
ncbi:hypothetical protein Tco_1372694 [Tanacetum coccineum]